MSKNFWEARNEIIDALMKQRSDLAYHREALDVFKKAYAQLDDETPDGVGDVLHDAITRETAKVASIENEIRGSERLLKEKYSLAPAC